MNRRNPFPNLATRMCIPVLALMILLVCMVPVSLNAQVGNDNPTGPAGSFNGHVTTAGSYDPLTGNATRNTSDLVLAASVGQYPLAFTRTSNSRSSADPTFKFGGSGKWTHGYAWSIDATEERQGQSFQPPDYTVHFPDGRVITFGSGGDAPAGVPERFQPLNLSTHDAALLLPDGGKVEFGAIRTNWYVEGIEHCSYRYWTKAIVDPHGLRTTFAYNGDGSLHTISEPAGRWIRLAYTTVGADRVIDYVEASDGRVVDYTYSQRSYAGTVYTQLDSVVYPYETTLGASPVASYTYQATNVADAQGQFTGTPLLSTCDDPMYAGPMKKIRYSYATVNGDPLVQVVAGQILSENHGTTGEVVSRLHVPFVTWRSEIRGDGPSRLFEYNGAFLWRDSDYQNQRATHIRTNGDLTAITDRRGNTTDLGNHHPVTRVPTLITYPLTPADNGTRATVQSTYGGPNCPDVNNRDGNNPYYVHSVKNERGHWTTYWRDVNKRVGHIDYPNGGWENFSYNQFGQVTSHRMTSGGTEYFNYDGRGMLQSSTNAEGKTPITRMTGSGG
jgi:hypothetical protein